MLTLTEFINNLPKTFRISDRAPTLKELYGLYIYLKTLNPTKFRNILEAGTGITTYITFKTLSPDFYIAIEDFKPCVQTVKDHTEDVIIIDNWDKIPSRKYDLILVDSSSCPPKNLKTIRNIRKPFRDDFIKYVLPLSHKNTIFIIHDDFHPQAGWRVTGEYLKNHNNHKYERIYEIKDRYGFGIYRRKI